MVQAGLWLLSVGVADALLAINAWRAGPRFVVAAVAAACLALVGSLAIGFGPGQSVLLGLVTNAGGGWVYLSARLGDRRMDGLALLTLGGTFVALLAVAGVWHWDYTGPVVHWYVRYAPRAVHSLSFAGFVMAVGTVVFLQATGNVIVRHVLALSGTPTQKAESQLRGGRFIGGLERTFIFGLAVAGDPTAAAIVVAAKSLLRFPEIRSSGSGSGGAAAGAATEPNIHEVTEYFLVGSLVSWLLALMFVPLVVSS